MAKQQLTTVQRLQKEIVGLLSSPRVINLQRKAPLIFVCGADQHQEESLRGKFLEWVPIGLPEYRVVLAEEAYRVANLGQPFTKINLSAFEHVIGEVADCVLIFPESAGSIAELGLFSALERIRQKTLVVNDISMQCNNSFITMGPLDTIANESRFHAVVQLDIDRVQSSPTARSNAFGQVGQKIRLIDGVRCSPEDFYVRPGDQATVYRSALAATLEVVRLLRVCNYRTIILTVKAIFKEIDETSIAYMLSILVALEYVKVATGEYYAADNPFLVYREREWKAEEIKMRSHSMHTASGDEIVQTIIEKVARWSSSILPVTQASESST